jgi:lincosamide nucleotidyltransferase B/F
MTTKTAALLTRLHEIGQSVAASEGGLALLGLGSVGVERDRLDDYSDLDFFVVVEQGSKDRFLQDLDWLARIAPLAYAFMNTDDGYKVLFVDGIFCEFAVFEPEELKNAMYTGGLWVWRRDDFEGAAQGEGKRPLSTPSASDPQRLLGEALTNLYVGLGRFHRGEKLSAMRFIQGYAVDRVIELAALTETEQPAFP